MARKDEYYVFAKGRYGLFELETLLWLLRQYNPRPRIWSARFSTGLFGLTSCPSGNKGPKKFNEVLLALGDEGLAKLIDLGFITCPVCRPENTTGFWDAAKDAVQRKHGLASLAAFTDKTVLPFDARRVAWEEIVSLTRYWPNRLYVPKGLMEVKLRDLKGRIQNIGHGFPPVGYYNSEVAERFTEYDLG